MTISGTSQSQNRSRSRAAKVGWLLSGLVILMLGLDALGKLIAPEMMITNSPPLGLPADPAFHRMLGTILAICTLLYGWSRTSALGAVLLTAYLGGAFATHLRVGSPLLTHTLISVYIGALLWGGLLLRDRRIRLIRIGATSTVLAEEPHHD